MYYKQLASVIATILMVSGETLAAKASCPPFPANGAEYTSQFQEPLPPLVKPEFETHFIQHKWNQNLSHITTGYIHNIPSKGIVRVDQALETGIASSLFDYSNTTKDGLVDNTLTSVSAGDFAHPTVWRGYVNSNFPLFTDKFLVDNGAVFGGLVKRVLQSEKVAAWQILYQGVIPVTVFVDRCAVVVGYEYFTPIERTHVTTSFFNTINTSGQK